MGQCGTSTPNEQSIVNTYSLTIIYKPNADEYNEYYEYELKAKAYDEVTLKAYGHETIDNIIHRLSKCPSFDPPQNKYFSVNQMELFDPDYHNEFKLALNRDQRISTIWFPSYGRITLYAKYPKLKVPSCDDQDITALPSNHSDYRYLENRFQQKMNGNAKLLDIYRINKSTVDMPIFHTIRKSKNKAKAKRLYHGTSFENAGNIIKGGFDRTYNRRSAYGYGTYLAASPVTASSYCRRYHGQTKRPIYCMLVCNTIVGNMGTGGSGYRGYGNYDSLVDNVHKPSIYVIYKDYHSIPVYLMVFEYDDDNNH